MSIPKIVWMFWLQGFDAAPPLAHTCIQSWERNNPDWSIRLVSESNVRDYLDPAFCDDLFSTDLPFRKIANIVRLALIARHGGVWADADCFCTCPLDDWIHEAAGSGFFAFRFLESDYWLFAENVPLYQRWMSRNTDRVMANWFLAGSPNNYITTSFCTEHFELLKLAEKATKPSLRSLRKKFIKVMRRNAYIGSLMGSMKFVSRVGQYPNFIFHYHFARKVQTDTVFREKWTAVQARSARDALAYSKTLGLPVDEVFKKAVSDTNTPVYKFHSRHSAPLQEGVQTRFEWLQSSFD